MLVVLLLLVIIIKEPQTGRQPHKTAIIKIKAAIVSYSAFIIILKGIHYFLNCNYVVHSNVILRDSTFKRNQIFKYNFVKLISTYIIKAHVSQEQIMKFHSIPILLLSRLFYGWMQSCIMFIEMHS